MLIYFGYGIWNSTLEICAREEIFQQSTYQRYDGDVDDSFTADDGFGYPEEGGGQHQDWGAPEDRGYHYQQQQAMPDSVDNRTSHSSKPKSKGKSSRNSEALIASDELDYSPE